jgi:outer membrane lipoprotein-sorting protein
MFETTIAFLDDKNSVWSGRPAFADAVTRAKAAVTAIDSAADKQQTPTIGMTDDKADVRNALEEKLLEVADQVSALAAKTGNHDLAARSRRWISFRRTTSCRPQSGWGMSRRHTWLHWQITA